MTWSTEIVESIEQVDPREWDQLVKEHSFASQRWLKVTEAVLLNHHPRYVLLRRDGQLQAGAVCYLQNQFQSQVLQTGLGWFIGRFPGLRCAVPISYDPGLFFCDENLATELLPELLKSIQTLIKRDRISFHTIDHLLSANSDWAFLQTNGYHRIGHLAEIYLDLPWASFEEYLKQLSSKKRKEYVRISRRLEREGILLELADLQTEDAGVLRELVNNVFKHHNEPNVYIDELFLKASHMMGDDFKLIVAHQNGKTIGCIAMLRGGNEWICKWMGLNYEQTLDSGTYYGLLAECVRHSIQAGGSRLRMGATSYQTKQHFGVTV